MFRTWLISFILLANSAVAQTEEKTPGPAIVEPAQLAEYLTRDCQPDTDCDTEGVIPCECDSVLGCGCAVCDCPLCAAPGMIGDYFGGYGMPIGGVFTSDRLLVLANDLDAPVVLPPGGSALTITEAGPVTIVSGALNIQQIQAALRAGDPLPTLSAEGSVADSRTLTTALSITQIQTLLASTTEAYDIVPLVAPPGSYDTEVAAVFATRNTVAGTSTYDTAGSGALLQAGADTLAGGEDFDAFYFYNYNVQLLVPTPGSAFGNQGRLKVATGNSAQPRDRVYFRYGLFDGVAGPAGDFTLNRFTPGFERAFADGQVSFELRAPFAATVSNTGSLGPGGVVGDDVLFGDLTMFGKVLLLNTSNLLVSGGLGIGVPTADDITVTLADATPLVDIHHNSVHLKPFLAALYARQSGFFAQGFLEVDVDINGDSVAADLGSGLATVGTLYDATYLFTDVGVGYRVVDPFAGIKAVSPTVELHYNAALEGANQVQAGLVQIGGIGTNLNTVNATVGTTVEINESTTMAAGYVVPIGGGADQQLDGGMRISVEYRPK